MKVLILRHSTNTPPGTCLEWLKTRGHEHEILDLHDGASLPDLRRKGGSFDRVFVLGGPMNVDDVAIYPWLEDEKSFLRETIAEGMPCLGLCLGGQLLAQCLGAPVTQNKFWEAGWHRVTFDRKQNPLMVFQWHHDQFALPAGAERFGTNEITANQGFLFKSVVGLQFHPEASAAWVRQCATDKDYPPEGPTVQSADAVLAGLSHLPAMTDWFFNLLDEKMG